MKAGIITFHNALNYGAVLQTYALHQKLTELGCDAKVIDYRNPRVAKKNAKPQLKDYRNPLKYRNDTIIYRINQRKEEKIARFSERYIQKTLRASLEDLREIGKQFDMVFTGSDQVWNDDITDCDEAYYLDFVAPEKRCSYAASIGKNAIPEKYVPRVRGLLSDFRAISVREKTAEDALRNQMGIEAVTVLDPTFLLDEGAYSKIATSQNHERFILLYMLFYSDSLIASARKIAQKRRLPLYCINSSGKVVTGTVDKSDVGVEEWLELFMKADFVFTNSFHGTAFSINMNRQFNVELPPAKINAESRVTDILKKFKLETRIVSECRVEEETIDYEKVNAALAVERENARAFLRSSIDGQYVPKKQSPDKSILGFERSYCCGCGLCEKICPKNAIHMCEDDRGFQHPHVEYEECIQCGLCKTQCPFSQNKNAHHEKKPIEIYAAYSTTPEIVYNSSSGGVFYELAKQTIGEGGVVYGAAFSDDFTLEHHRAERLEEIKPMMGSKYMQSNAFLSFDMLRKDLHDGRKVLFVGTPCQCAAVQSLFRKLSDNLILVDFVCHGVPSPILIKDHIKYVEQFFKSKIADYHPRSKIAGWGHHELFTFENGKKRYLDPISQAYKNIFYRDCALRESCYSCPYTNFDRHSDITMADYWGLEEKRPDLVRNEGVSMVMINSPRGKTFFSRVSALHIDLTDADTVSEKKQPHLFRPLKKAMFADQFWDDYHHKGWEYVAKKYAECDPYSLVKWKLKAVLHSIKKR